MADLGGLHISYTQLKVNFCSNDEHLDLVPGCAAAGGESNKHWDYTGVIASQENISIDACGTKVKKTLQI